jgi:hypothetical protein
MSCNDEDVRAKLQRRQGCSVQTKELMFVGHYGVAFAIKTPRNKIALWLFLVAVQLLDFLWARSRSRR